MSFSKENHRYRFHPGKVVFFILVAIAFAIFLGGIVMWLWNAILPDLVGVNPIRLEEAIGLLVLSRILFGSFRFGPRAEHFARKRKQWKEKWHAMSEEERAELKARWQERCKK